MWLGFGMQEEVVGNAQEVLIPGVIQTGLHQCSCIDITILGGWGGPNLGRKHGFWYSPTLLDFDLKV